MCLRISIFTHVGTSGGKWLWNLSVGVVGFCVACNKNGDDPLTSPLAFNESPSCA